MTGEAEKYPKRRAHQAQGEVVVAAPGEGGPANSAAPSGAQQARIVDVRHGPASRGRAHLIYAHLVEADTGELIMGATLADVLAAVAARGLVLVGDRGR